MTLPANANDTPLGAAFWGDLLGVTPAHSPYSFALVDKAGFAAIFTAADGSGGHISVFSIDAFGDLSAVAISDPLGIASFNGVAFSQ